MDDAQAAARGFDGNDVPSALVSILLLGDTRDPEMAPIAGKMVSIAGGETRIAPDVESACRFIENDHWHPDLIVVLQTWSDQFSSADVLELLAHAPLARTVCAAGAWCDSDSRTRTSWPLAVRIRAVDALARIDREFANLRSDAVAGNQIGMKRKVLPLTASRAEVFDVDLIDSLTVPIDGSRIVVRSPDRAWKQMIENALGVPPSPAEGFESPAIVVVDVDPWDERSRNLLRDARSDWPDTRVVACSGSFAADFRGELLSAGADDAWFKLSALASLKHKIRNVLPSEPPA